MQNLHITQINQVTLSRLPFNQNSKNAIQGNNKLIICIILLFSCFYPQVCAFGQTDADILVQGNSAFAIDIYRKLCVTDGNIFFSPYSISTALAMVYAGASGSTEQEIAKTLRFYLNQSSLHQAFETNTSIINNIHPANSVQLSIANSIWPDKDYTLRENYVSLIKKYYGVAITPVDFKQASSSARITINRWVEENTQKKIKEILQPGDLNSLTRLILVNAIYFKGNWENQFKVQNTKKDTFYLFRNKTVKTPMMHQKCKLRYAEFDKLQLLDIPYIGDKMSMLVLLPEEVDGLEKLEGILTIEEINKWKSRTNKQEIEVYLPKFKMASTFNLSKNLESMGMVQAFNPNSANFSGISDTPDPFFIGEIIHKAYVDVNEEGTEAAASTAIVGIKAAAIPEDPPVFRADHPFIFFILENGTGSILFMGRVSDPTKTGE